MAENNSSRFPLLPVREFLLGNRDAQTSPLGTFSFPSYVSHAPSLWPNLNVISPSLKTSLPVSILHSPGHHDLWNSHTCCPLGTLTGPCFTLTAALRLPVTSPLPQKRPILQRCCSLEKPHDQSESELWTTLRVTPPNVFVSCHPGSGSSVAHIAWPKGRATYTSHLHSSLPILSVTMTAVTDC